VVGFQDTSKKCLEIQPFKKSPSYGPVIKIESVYVNVSPHLLSHKKAGAP
jgi:hypothetical protein